MRNRFLLVAVFLLPLLFTPSRSSAGTKQLIVSLSRGGFVAFRSETEWAKARKGSQFSRVTSSVLSSQALVDENQVIHRLLFDPNGKVLFGYDLLVEPDAATKRFQISVKPLDPAFEESLNAYNPDIRIEAKARISTLPKTADPQLLDDGDAFSLDLLINETTGIKIVDIVKVSFDPSNLWEVNPRSLPRDFTLESVALGIKDYRLLLNGEVLGVGRATSTYEGPLVWFYVQGRGRFIFSLTPRSGYDFRKLAVVDDHKIQFSVGSDQYELISSAPILPGGGTWYLWMLHDKHFTPLIAPAEKSATPSKDSLEKFDGSVRAARERIDRMRKPRATGLVSKAEREQAENSKPQVLVGATVRIEDILRKP
jgi:hypothetical protein